jgi:hypothetical protein
MAHVLTPSVCEGLEAELYIAPLDARECLGHGEDEHPIAVSSIRQFAIDGLWQDNLTVIGAYGPFREQHLWLVVARTTIFPAHGEVVTPDGDQNVFGLQTWHRRSQYQPVLSLMELDGNGLLLCGGIHGVLLFAQYERCALILREMLCCARARRHSGGVIRQSSN